MENLVMIAALIRVMVGMRVPSPMGRFNNYIRSVLNFLNASDPVTHVTNAARLGLLADELTQLNALLAQWIALYALHTNPETKTKKTRVMVITFIKNFKSVFSPMLMRMDGSPNITNDDRLLLNIAIKGPYSRKKLQIKAVVYELAKQLGGGDVEITCRTESDGKRASIQPQATGWYIAYDIYDPKIDNPELYPKVKKIPPQSPDDCFNYGFYTRAKDVLKIGAEHKGRFLVYFIRWYDHRNPALSGPYGPAKTIIIL